MEKETHYAKKIPVNIISIVLFVRRWEGSTSSELKSSIDFNGIQFSWKVPVDRHRVQ